VRHGAGIQPPFIMAALYLAVMNTSTLIRRRHFAVCAVGLAMLLPWAPCTPMTITNARARRWPRGWCCR